MVSLRARVALCLSSLLGLAATGCTSDAAAARTELLLVADTDIEALSSITFEVSAQGHPTARQSGEMPSDRSPLTLGIVRDKGPLGPITTVAHGFVGDQEIITRVSVVSFVPGRTVVVPLHLLASCLEVACADDETCTETGCVGVDVAPEDLHAWTGSPPHIVPMDMRDALDAGAMTHDAAPGDAEADDDAAGEDEDAAEDAGPDEDAGNIDGGMDTGVLVDLDAAGASDAEVPDASALLDGGNAGDANTFYDCGTTAGSLDLANDPAHCGGCGYSCPTTYSGYHAQPTCAAFTCGFRCDNLYGNCNQVLFVDFDGCETFLGNDPANCGVCGRKCTNSQSCVLGVCIP